MKKRIATLLAAVTLLITTLTGCSLFEKKPTSALGTYDFKQMDLVQLREPNDGQPMAIISTKYGEMRVVLYPEYAPNMVANFIARVNDGFYDGKDVFAIYKDAYFLTGAETIEGTSGVTSDGNPIPNECTVNLWPFKGALLSYNATEGYGDSRFFIVNDVPLTEEELAQLRSYTDEEGNRALPEELISAFVEVGSIAHVAGVYTVFGQVIQGLDVVEKITAIESDEETLAPKESVKIDKIVMSEYKTGDPFEIKFEYVPEETAQTTTQAPAETTAAR